MGAEAVNGELGQVSGLPGREALERGAEGEGRMMMVLRGPCFWKACCCLHPVSPPHSLASQALPLTLLSSANILEARIENSAPTVAQIAQEP